MKPGFLRTALLCDRGLRIGWAVLVLILLIIVGEAAVVDPLGLLLESLGLGRLSGTSASDWATLLNETVKRLARIGVVLGAAHLVLIWAMKGSLRSAGFRTQRGSVRDLGVGIGIGAMIQVIALLLMYRMGWLKISGFAWQFRPAVSSVPAIVHALVIGVETAFIEEGLCRGFLIAICRDRYGLRNAVLLSSLFFGLVHFSGFSAEFPWWLSVVSATLAGLVFAQAFLVRGTLWSPIGMHFGWIAAARVLGTVGVSSQDAICLVTEVDGPELLVATRAGGAGGFELAGMAVASLLLWLLGRTSDRTPHALQ